MKYKNIYAAHEARMWISTIVVPVITGVITVIATSPEIRCKAKEKVVNVKEKVKNAFTKKGVKES